MTPFLPTGSDAAQSMREKKGKENPRHKNPRWEDEATRVWNLRKLQLLARVQLITLISRMAPDEYVNVPLLKRWFVIFFARPW